VAPRAGPGQGPFTLHALPCGRPLRIFRRPMSDAAAPDPLLDDRVVRLARLLGMAPRPDGPPDPGVPRAAVALLVRPGPDDVELLLIRRAERAGDPWSGHMALPGGRADAADADSVATAVRETREEVGIDLGAVGRVLGSLDVLRPASGGPLRIVVHPHVFAVPAGTEAVPNHEVDAALWVRVGELTVPEAATRYVLEMEGTGRMTFPAYGTRGHVIWGLTYRMLFQFLEHWAEAVEPREDA
jgi:8-oxo-dGTP pyrophosphatase MutT (NUDIX family)